MKSSPRLPPAVLHKWWSLWPLNFSITNLRRKMGPQNIRRIDSAGEKQHMSPLGSIFRMFSQEQSLWTKAPCRNSAAALPTVFPPIEWRCVLCKNCSGYYTLLVTGWGPYWADNIKILFFCFVFCSLVEAFGKMQESELTTSRVAHRVLDVSEEAIVGNRGWSLLVKYSLDRAHKSHGLSSQWRKCLPFC